MPSNQRQNSRKSKKEHNAAKARRIIWIIIATVAVILLVMKIVEVDFNSVKRRFVDGEGNFKVNLEVDTSIYPFQFDSAGNIRMHVQGDRLTVLTGSGVTVLNPQDGSKLNTFNHGYSNPMIRCAGNYLFTFDQGGTRFRLDNLRENEYSEDASKLLLNADVSPNGTVIYATRSDRDKSALTVMTKALKKVLQLNVSSGYIVQVAIDASGKRCAYAAVNTKDGQLVTTVYTINVGDKKERASFDFVGGNVLGLHYCDDDLYIIGDSFVSTVTSQKRRHDAVKQGSAETVCYAFTKENELLYAYADYASGTQCHLADITTGGRVRRSIDLKQRPKSVSCVSSEICVLNTDNIKIYSLTRGEEKASFKCDSAITQAYKLSSKVFVSRSQQIDVIE